MRFHGVIFSTIAAVPFISIAHRGKHSLYCEQYHLKPSYVSLDEISGYKFLSAVDDVNGTYRIGNRLRDLSAQNRMEIKNLLASYG
jgi:polysaccharide pyruvyl transferase WcaK-like protein